MAVETLSSIHQSQPAARKLFDWILEAGVDDDRTTVEGLMESCDVTRRQAITVLRSLADAGHGEFKVGRKGHPSRLEWSENPVVLARRLATGEVVDEELDPADAAPDAEAAEEVDPADAAPELAPDPPSRSSGELFPEMFAPGPSAPARPLRSKRLTTPAPELIQHSYVLRPRLRIVVDLPEDLSAREAEVLGEWLRNLSFER